MKIRQGPILEQNAKTPFNLSPLPSRLSSDIATRMSSLPPQQHPGRHTQEWWNLILSNQSLGFRLLHNRHLRTPTWKRHVKIYQGSSIRRLPLILEPACSTLRTESHPPDPMKTMHTCIIQISSWKTRVMPKAHALAGYSSHGTRPWVSPCFSSPFVTLLPI